MDRKQFRWIVIWMVFIATSLSFLDRQVLSVSIIKIQQEFGMSDVQYGWVNTCFLISYALMFTVSGRLTDRFGGKLGLGMSVGFWSIASGLHAVMTGFPQLLVLRFLLGAGEGGCFPGAARIVNEWFAEKEKALANGIAIGGSAIGAVIAPPLTTYIALHAGWRISFIVPAMIGILWFVCWMLLPSGPRSSGKRAGRVRSSGPSLGMLLGYRATWVFVLIRFLLDPVMYFIMFWVPKYLNQARGMAFEKIGSYFWIPFLALGLSNILGGWVSDRLIVVTGSVNRSRKTVMGVAAVLTMVAPVIAWSSSAEVAVALVSVMLFAHGLWITNYITSIADVFGSGATSTVVGISGTAGAVSSLVINPLIGVIIARYSYTPLWVVCGLLYPIAFVLLLVLVPKLKALLF